MVPGWSQSGHHGASLRSAAGRRVDRVADEPQDVGEGPAEDAEDDRGEGGVSARMRPYSTTPWPSSAGRAFRRCIGQDRSRRRPGRSSDQVELGAVAPTAPPRCRASTPGSGSRARSTAAGPRSRPRGRPRRRSRASARRSSIIAASAGGRSVVRPDASGVASGVRLARWSRGAGHPDLDCVGPVEADRDAVGADAEVRRQRLVDHPEQAALEVHRQAPVRAERIEVDRDAGPPAALARRATQGRARARGRRGPSAGRRR